MAKVRTSLPDPPGCGGWITTTLLACLLVAINSAIARSCLGLLASLLPDRVSDPRWQQALLYLLSYLLPVLAMVLELWGLAALFRVLWPRRTNSSGRE